jgi:hypothetical protein
MRIDGKPEMDLLLSMCQPRIIGSLAADLISTGIMRFRS